jgi:hypothetical protein
VPPNRERALLADPGVVRPRGAKLGQLGLEEPELPHSGLDDLALLSDLPLQLFRPNP